MKTTAVADLQRMGHDHDVQCTNVTLPGKCRNLVIVLPTTKAPHNQASKEADYPAARQSITLPPPRVADGTGSSSGVRLSCLPEHQVRRYQLSVVAAN